jgi:hypothetical protein
MNRAFVYLGIGAGLIAAGLLYLRIRDRVDEEVKVMRTHKPGPPPPM